MKQTSNPFSQELLKAYQSFTEDPSKEKFELFKEQAISELGKEQYELCVSFYLQLCNADVYDALLDEMQQKQA